MSSKHTKSKSIQAPALSTEQYQQRMNDHIIKLQMAQESLNSIAPKKSSKTSFENALKVRESMKNTAIQSRLLKSRLVLEKRRLDAERADK